MFIMSKSSWIKGSLWTVHFSRKMTVISDMEVQCKVDKNGGDLQHDYANHVGL